MANCAVLRQASLQSYTPILHPSQSYTSHTSALVSYKCKGTERRISPLALLLLKGHKGSAILFLWTAISEITKSEFHLHCAHFLFSLHLETSSLSPLQAAYSLPHGKFSREAEGYASLPSPSLLALSLWRRHRQQNTAPPITILPTPSPVQTLKQSHKLLHTHKMHTLICFEHTDAHYIHFMFCL